MARKTKVEPSTDLAASSERSDESTAIPGIATATPSMAQFLEIKAANPDSILWYRMGDFYELFFEDAVKASAALGIVLTKRGKHLGQDIPMCGVPVVRADDYLQRLIRLGYRVAVCEQMEDPAEARKRGSKAVVRRDVVRLVTPGTLTEDTLLDAKSRNYLTALHLVPAGGGFALASLDISTGEFEVGTAQSADLPGELARLAPGEIIATDDTLRDVEVKRWIEALNIAATPVVGASFDVRSGERALKERLKVVDLGAFGTFSRGEFAAVAALITYVDLTQIGRRPALRPPRRTGPDAILVIDAATRASLELVKSTSGDKHSCLLGAMDQTVTASGARELAGRIASPLKDVVAINARLDCVGYLVETDSLRDKIRDQLLQAPDIARATSRLALQRGGPRDLSAIAQGLRAAGAIAAVLNSEADRMGLPDDLASIAARLIGVPDTVAGVLDQALVDDAPHLKRDGGFVRSGYRADLDEARGLGADSRRIIAELEAKYVEATGVRPLKVRHNNILGYFVEVTQLNAKPLQAAPHDTLFRHKQTMANAMRFTTPELIEIEGRIATAGDRALAIELEVFNELAQAVQAQEAALGHLAGALAELDHVCGLATLARDHGYVRPIIDDSTVFDIRGGRHPVVELALKASKAGAFIENDCMLGAKPHTPTGFDEQASGRLWLVTGPNMAGKSTFLRQNALIALMAQMGSFVPARSAHIGVVDRLFSRVGASDDLARGRSTFMVEMVETAGILNQASEHSLVILDEIGRGTATFDGLSIAWATVEHLHDVNRCRALFATHFHELTQLAGRLSEVANVTVDVKEWHDEIVFLHKIKPGAADRSYGIQVAKLAGLPVRVVKRATEVLARLEKNNRRANGGGSTLEDLPLFAAAPAPAKTEILTSAALSPLEVALADIRPDELTPKDALEIVYRLKSLVR